VASSNSPLTEEPSLKKRCCLALTAPTTTSRESSLGGAGGGQWYGVCNRIGNGSGIGQRRFKHCH
jgi:hypothetical protein